MSRVVHLHVGTAKSGTTWLQHVLAKNRPLLSEHGYLYPGTRNSHFLASLDLRETSFMGHTYPRAAGAWQRVVEEVDAFEGQALVSHETMAASPPHFVEKAVGSFPDSEVRVVLTCRDLARQLPAAWQERVKNRNEGSYEDYLTEVREGWNEGRPGEDARFWYAQGIPGIARRWADEVGPERVTVVTVPPPGGAVDLLWDRFRRAAAIPEVAADLDVATSNVSLGAAEVELLRRLNGQWGEEVPWPQYERLIKHRLVRREIGGEAVAGRLSVPEAHRAWVDRAAESVIEQLRADQITVVGDLEELRPRYLSSWTDPGSVRAEELLDVAVRLLASTAMRPPEQPPRRRKRRARQTADASAPPSSPPGVREAAHALLVASRARLRQLRSGGAS